MPLLSPAWIPVLLWSATPCFPGQPPLVATDCYAQTSARLDVASPIEQMTFAAHLARCQAQVGCAYVGCQ